MSTSSALLVLGRDPIDLDKFVVMNGSFMNEVTRCVLMSNPNSAHGKYASIGNRFFEAATEDVVGMMHADVILGAGTLTSLVGIAAAPPGAVVGIVGRTLEGAYVWSRDGGGIVSTLDCCSVFFRRDAGLAFDGIVFDDYHMVVEDLCVAAAARGIVTKVGRGPAEHHGTEYQRDRQWVPACLRYRDLLDQKWLRSGLRYRTTAHA